MLLNIAFKKRGPHLVRTTIFYIRKVKKNILKVNEKKIMLNIFLSFIGIFFKFIGVIKVSCPKKKRKTQIYSA